MWLDIQDEIHKVFGHPERYKTYIKLLKKVNDKLADTITLTGREQRKANMELKIAESELQRFMNQDYGSSTDETLVAINKHMGFHLSLKTISIREFMGYQESLKKAIATQKTKKNG